MKYVPAIVLAAMVVSGCASTNNQQACQFVSAYSAVASPFKDEVANLNLIEATQIGKCIINSSQIFLTQAHYVRQGAGPRGANFIVFHDASAKVIGFWRTDVFYSDIRVRDNSIWLNGAEQFSCQALLGEAQVLLDGKVQSPIKRGTPNQAL